MKEYDDFISNKIKLHGNYGFDATFIPEMLFDFQKSIVKTAIKKGRYAIFADCGLGKTLMQITYAENVCRHTGGRAVIICPLAVSGQTINEGKKIGIEIEKGKGRIQIINYERIDELKSDDFDCVVLDESSILKNYTGKTKRKLISMFERTKYRLCCTATPSPNDYGEIGNHSEFLGILDSSDMRSRWFIRDEGINNYRLKGHAVESFFEWISSWSVMLQRPSDMGFSDDGFVLPGIKITEERVKTKKRDNGMLFNDIAVNATNFNQELRDTLDERIKIAVNAANGSDEQFIVWCKHNEESGILKRMIAGAVEVRGSEDADDKEEKLLGFANGKYRVLVTKAKIAQYGLNFQNCHNQIFVSYDFSFESLYQAIRRSYRFMQKHVVNVILVSTDTMQNVSDAIKQKSKQFEEMREGMAKSINQNQHVLVADYVKDEYKHDLFTLVNGDSCVEIKDIEDNSVDLSVFSPPFSSLYTYSDNVRDMGNCDTDDEFFEQYKYLVQELFRVMRPGRIVAVHTKDLAVYKNDDGYSGIYDFTGDNLRLFEKCGFKYHSKITIWTDPVLEMQRTKTQRLLYKQLRADSSLSGVGLPEYLTLFRKWELADTEMHVPITNKNEENFDLETWQQWASPVWMDIRRTDVLNGREGFEMGDEKHICPLQLSVIERVVKMWSNPGELVFTPFLGIGSEVYQAVKYGRRGYGIELKKSYWETAIKNCLAAASETRQLKIF